MPTYHYKARSSDGDERSGAIETSSKEAALELLQDEGLIVTGLEEETKSFSDVIRGFSTGRVRERDVVVFSRELAVLFEARVPVLFAFETLATEIQRPVFRKALGEIINDLKGGLVMSQALAKHPQIFSPFYVSMVRSGEESGTLLETFTYLADYLERMHELAGKAKHALIYPAFVLTAFFGIMIVMLVVVIPQLIPVFEEFTQEPPLFARIAFALSIFLRSYGIVVAVIVAASVLAVWRWMGTAPGRLFIDRLELHTPYLGSLFQKFYVARFTDNLQTLIKGGIPILRALTVTSEVAGNSVFQNAILHAREAVKGGGTISAALAEAPEIPPLATQMIKIGESSGQLDVILGNLATFYRKEVELVVNNLVTLIEPFLILVLGGGVGFFVVSILGPLYNIVGNF